MRKALYNKFNDLTWEKQEHRYHKGSSKTGKLSWSSFDIKGKKCKVYACWMWNKPERIYPKIPKSICQGEKMKSRVAVVYSVCLVYRTNEVVFH